MNSIAKKISLAGSLLLLSACAHYPRHSGYYPDNSSYGGGYTVMQRSYYGGSPGYYNNYNSGREFFRYQDHDHHRDAGHHRSYSVPEHPRFSGENHRGNEVYQHPRHENSPQRRHDYPGYPEQGHHEHKNNWEERQFDRRGENQKRFSHPEAQRMRNPADDRRNSGRDWSQRQFNPQVENQNHRSHQEERQMFNRENKRGGDADHGRDNRWRNQKDNVMIAPADRTKFQHWKNETGRLPQ